ncbi:hypothetical protein [Flavobacterium panacis]|uniref:hypothetical protein n=1 Tax=Flavobacterium panacis TaxID=2962567 RepID=UPI00214E036E|nr:hypothetical protein [Flavobacterium panacis]MCR4032581.1 hypothetical protein [Flavobacterium panacis]
MKEKIKLVYILIITTILGCSSEDSSNLENQDFSKHLLKSVKVSKQSYVETYKYENGFLVEATFNWTPLQYNRYQYEYDADGKLLRQIFNSTVFSPVYTYSYSYDKENRLVKQTNVNTNDYALLEYGKNKVKVTSYYEKRFDVPTTLVTEFDTDATGRILKAVRTKGFVDSDGNEFYPFTEFTYDERGNVIKTTSGGDSVTEYQYDDKRNPLYYSYEKLNKSLYYLIYTESTNSLRDFSPNNLVAIKMHGLTYVKDQLIYNAQNFPVSQIRYIYEDGKNHSLTSDEKVFEYF